MPVLILTDLPPTVDEPKDAVAVTEVIEVAYNQDEDLHGYAECKDGPYGNNFPKAVALYSGW